MDLNVRFAPPPVQTYHVLMETIDYYVQMIYACVAQLIRTFVKHESTTTQRQIPMVCVYVLRIMSRPNLEPVVLHVLVAVSDAFQKTLTIATCARTTIGLIGIHWESVYLVRTPKKLPLRSAHVTLRVIEHEAENVNAQTTNGETKIEEYVVTARFIA